MKKRIIISLLSLTLVACGSVPQEFSSSSSSVISLESSSVDESPKKEQGITNTNLVLANTDDFKATRSLLGTGTQKILVVPCRFEGEREFTQENLDTIEQAFFGENLSTRGDNYYSLKEYYSKSSYGKLNIEGELTDVVTVPTTVQEVIEMQGYLPGFPASSLYSSSIVSDEKLREYDTDNDGFVDSVCFIYSSPTDINSNFWAWVHNFGTEADLTRPSFSRHMWAGIETFSNDQYDIDTHTIIHEAGHLFGLRDYYPSDNYCVALGGHSMMDYNICDHDPYSKMLLGWIDPSYYSYTSSTSTIELTSFQDTGEALLINPSWNHSVMDEYLLIEYYTPTGLNTLDSEVKYSTSPQGFTKPGIKIYHVDSRVAECDYNEAEQSLTFSQYVDNIPESSSSDKYYLIGASNNIASSYTDASRQGRYKQIALVENKTINLLDSGYTADDDSLFYVGDVFDSTDTAYLLGHKRFNNGYELNLSIEVNALDDDKATLTITLKE